MPPPKRKPDASERLGVPKARLAAPVKRLVGRPTKYDPMYCDEVVDLGAQGYGPTAIAHQLGVLRENLIQWTEKYPEFARAMKLARQAEQFWWEEAGRSGLYLERFNSAVWKTSMQARFREEYTERKVTELVGEGGGPVQIQPIRLAVEDMSVEARQALREALIKARSAPMIDHDEDEP